MNPETTPELRFASQQFPLSETGYFSALVLDYVAGKDSLKPFYNRFPEPGQFEAQMAEKSAGYAHRKVLVEALGRQYASTKLKPKGLERLLAEQAFTITTGHQVCLFTGPLYFIYKIASAIKTCQLLAAKYPGAEFVPVFWMATEDHDFAEANHFYLNDRKVEWESGQSGAVGRMQTGGLEGALEQLKDALGIGYHAAELIQLFEDAYLSHRNVADATRYIVHKLFGAYGVLCIDGDDPTLKALAVPAFRQELFESKALPAVEASSSRLSAKYNAQAHPRYINLFYLDDQLRERIVRDEEGHFNVLNSDLKFSADEMGRILAEHPERISPNVILRPLYQEMVLPNLAYIGGGGELAYWFQLKDMFAAFEVPFPMLMLRNSALVVPGKAQELMTQLALDDRHIFQDLTVTETELIKAASAHGLELDEARAAVSQLFDALEEKVEGVDPSLLKSARSSKVRTEHIIASLEKKLLRAERKKNEVLLERLRKWHDSLFPKGSLQERKLNFSVFYSVYGKDFIDALIEHFDPFAFEFNVLKEV